MKNLKEEKLPHNIESVDDFVVVDRTGTYQSELAEVALDQLMRGARGTANAAKESAVQAKREFQKQMEDLNLDMDKIDQEELEKEANDNPFSNHPPSIPNLFPQNSESDQYVRDKAMQVATNVSDLIQDVGDLVHEVVGEVKNPGNFQDMEDLSSSSSPRPPSPKQTSRYLPPTPERNPLSCDEMYEHKQYIQDSFILHLLKLLAAAIPLVIAESWSRTLLELGTVDDTEEHDPWVLFAIYLTYAIILTLISIILLVFCHMVHVRMKDSIVQSNPDQVSGFENKVSLARAVFGLTSISGSKGVIGMMIGWAYADVIVSFIFALMEKDNFHRIAVFYFVASILTIIIGIISKLLDLLVKRLRGLWRRMVLLGIMAISMATAKFWTFSFRMTFEKITTYWITVILMYLFLLILMVFITIIIAIGRGIIKRNCRKDLNRLSKAEIGYRYTLQTKLLEVTCGYVLGSWGWMCWSALWDPLENGKNPANNFFFACLEFLFSLVFLGLTSAMFDYVSRANYFHTRFGRTHGEVILIAFGWLTGESLFSLLTQLSDLIFGEEKEFFWTFLLAYTFAISVIGFGICVCLNRVIENRKGRVIVSASSLLYLREEGDQLNEENGHNRMVLATDNIEDFVIGGVDMYEKILSVEGNSFPTERFDSFE